MSAILALAEWSRYFIAAALWGRARRSERDQNDARRVRKAAIWLVGIAGLLVLARVGAILDRVPTMKLGRARRDDHAARRNDGVGSAAFTGSTSTPAER